MDKKQKKYQTNIKIVEKTEGIDQKILQSIMQFIKEGQNVHGEDFNKNASYIKHCLEQYFEGLWSVFIFVEGCGGSCAPYDSLQKKYIQIQINTWVYKIQQNLYDKNLKDLLEKSLIGSPYTNTKNLIQ